MTLEIEPLTRDAFAPYGDVIGREGASSYPINEGTTMKFPDLAEIDVLRDEGKPLIHIFGAEPRRFPFAITMMERHPLGSQAFVPLGAEPYLVVVAGSGDSPRPGDLRVFLASPDQGVNYARNVWHHPLIALNSRSDFLVIDRGGPGDNLELRDFAGEAALITDPFAKR